MNWRAAARARGSGKATEVLKIDCEVAAREVIEKLRSGKNIAVQRLEDGGVMLAAAADREGRRIVNVVYLTPSQWCEAIASARPVGDTAHDLEAARRFHGVG